MYPAEAIDSWSHLLLWLMPLCLNLTDVMTEMEIMELTMCNTKGCLASDKGPATWSEGIGGYMQAERSKAHLCLCRAASCSSLLHLEFASCSSSALVSAWLVARARACCTLSASCCCCRSSLFSTCVAQGAMARMHPN